MTRSNHNSTHFFATVGSLNISLCGSHCRVPTCGLSINFATETHSHCCFRCDFHEDKNRHWISPSLPCAMSFLARYEAVEQTSQVVMVHKTRRVDFRYQPAHKSGGARGSIPRITLVNNSSD